MFIFRYNFCFALNVTQEAEAALLGQVSEVANWACDSMLVARATCLKTAIRRYAGALASLKNAIAV